MTRPAPLDSRFGHTLIEMIAVVAVLAILALALTPVVIRRIDRAAWTKEVNDIGSISNALVLQALRNYSIPNETGWAAAAANWTARPVSQISTNNRGFARLFFYESSGWLASQAPYAQTANGTGTNAPLNARMAIVSTIARALPYSNGGINSANFSSIWNAANYTKPSFLSSWTGKGDDLVIQRINLDPLFRHLILTTRDTSTAAGYSVNSSSVHSAVPNTPTGLDSYYLDGTAIGLWVGATLTNTFLLKGDTSFTFDQGMWRSGLSGGGKDNSTPATNFSYQAKLFINTDNVPGGQQGATAQSLLSAFYSFLYGYTIWANECPHFKSSASSPGQQTDYQLLDGLGANSAIIDAAAGKQNGLLK